MSMTNTASVPSTVDAGPTRDGAPPSWSAGGYGATLPSSSNGTSHISEEKMRYLIPFAELKNTVKLMSVKGQLKVDLTYDEFLDIMKQLLLGASIDESWYCTTYPDVAEAIEVGTYRDARHHFVSDGYIEGRRPFPMQVDEAWYLETYPDVRDGIESGLFESANDHFARHGYEEGRRPASV